jgi:sulfate permease, SulP family
MMASLTTRLQENWKAGLTVALISVPLSIALSVASGAGPVPGIITGVWATLIAGFFGGSNYNIVGAAGALTTVLFAATLAAPLGLGAAVLPLLALATGVIIFLIWLLRADRFLYYIPSSVMYGFAGGVAFLIAASQLFDATGLSALKRTGHFTGDIELFIQHFADVHTPTFGIFVLFIVGILAWKRYVKLVPAVIPAALVGILVGALDTFGYIQIGLTTLGDKFGAFSGSLMMSVPWGTFAQVVANPEHLRWILGAAGTIALIAVLETLITAQIADKLTKTQFSSRKELLGLALANLGSGSMGGLPATGVFIRTGANIKAGATHKTAAVIAALITAVIALIALPFFSYIPMAVIAAILANTALGLIEIHQFKEFWRREKESFFVAILVLLVTVFEDAGVAVVVGAVVALLLFADRVSRGHFDVMYNFADGTKRDERHAKVLGLVPNEKYTFVTYSVAGFLGYIDSSRHAANFRTLAQAATPIVVIRLRNLFSVDYEGEEMLAEGIAVLEAAGKTVYLSSMSGQVRERLMLFPAVAALAQAGRLTKKVEDAIAVITKKS